MEQVPAPLCAQVMRRGTARGLRRGPCNYERRHCAAAQIRPHHAVAVAAALACAAGAGRALA
eukprot:CAMPEP_0171276386 /NCGR_PEP_ID=MMETSP0790-20130122/63811_1 /TAXON_ID=2925 /ORGANISM="Alexandrium catenella, Strain OF101" /LENGTH=61 /DNA_ID=CAMNT_0011745479 /DNA_START=68 /DNA_END=250 /DNA_ORIENTATION=+